ncbi:MAG: radical SAM protein, partial [Oscillospiraceae bacterium]|nr:radical SAM protein [Oscillospiraceae bacterium]
MNKASVKTDGEGGARYGAVERFLLKTQRPARYTGGEVNAVYKDPKDVDLRFALCFPDTYEIGMSHLGMKILYSLINAHPKHYCERVFMPLPDMRELMRANFVPLYALESGDGIRGFDIIGFTLQYELCYTTVLAMLDLAGIPVLKSERGYDFPLIIAGGPCACNPEPLCDFIDLFVIGEGEEVTPELLGLYDECKKSGVPRPEFLKKAALIGGVYVPDLSVGAKKRFIADLNGVFFPKSFVVPFVETVHDRAVTEIIRGCIRGCRFCQAGFIYRPFREKRRGVIAEEVRALCESTGYDEVSLCSLSVSDYSEIEGLLKDLTDYTDKNGINLSLPSTRIDKFNKQMLDRVKSVRKSGLTFAPEAGTQRLRDVINKNITEEDILKGCKTAFEGGYGAVKLYFMLGLPTETNGDVAAIHGLTESVTRLFREINPKKSPAISISLSTFVPKPFTPFQYEPMISRETADERQKLLLSLVKSRKIKISRSDYNMS